MMPEVINKGTHFGIGVWVGLRINDPDTRASAGMIGLGFGTYQVLEAFRKGDQGYPELAQFIAGIVTAQIYLELKERYPSETARVTNIVKEEVAYAANRIWRRYRHRFNNSR